MVEFHRSPKRARYPACNLPKPNRHFVTATDPRGKQEAKPKTKTSVRRENRVHNPNAIRYSKQPR